MSSAAVAGLHEQLGVGTHEGDGHPDLAAIRKGKSFPVPMLLDDREDVVPAAGVEAGGVLTQLAEDLVHLEGRSDRLDQHGGSDRPEGDSELVLRSDEHVVPQAGFEVALELGQIEVRAGPPLHQLTGVVEEEHAEVEQGCRDRLAVDEDMAFREMPASRPHHEGCDLIGQAILLAGLGSGEVDLAPDGIEEVLLPVGDVRPGGGVRVLEVGHEHPGARVEGVDHHLAVRGTGDLASTVGEIGGWLRNRPRVVSHRGRVGPEVEQCSGVELRLSPDPCVEQLPTRPIEPPMQAGDEGQGLVGEERIRPLRCGDDECDSGHRFLLVVGKETWMFPEMQ